MAVGREEEIAEAAAWGRRRPPPPPPLPARAAAAAARGMRREGVARRRAWAPSRRLAEETTEGRAILLRVCLLFKSSFYLYTHSVRTRAELNQEPSINVLSYLIALLST